LEKQGKTVMELTSDNNTLGIIAVADTLKQDAKQMVTELTKMHVKVWMVTGDNERTARAIAAGWYYKCRQAFAGSKIRKQELKFPKYPTLITPT
jgi:P-type E1-E2 ATPase